MPKMTFSAVIRKEGAQYSAWCPELDVASQGATVEAALANLKEAVELFLEDEEAPDSLSAPILTSFEVERGPSSKKVRT
ncbi:MAG TPA: type II toxin-antitoxin system HicB family antitoxin [Candidatus Thermoplasmatota archaeon]|nr:type II toxin-antitoxin system HicB family antitoxin [Candidatus Thermoplasmatota archaeon]